MEKILISQNDAIGQRQYWHEDDEGNVTIQTQQDITAVVEANKATFNQVDERAGWKGEMHRVASIPMSVFYDLKSKGIIDDPIALKKWLNSGENAVFRTRPGRV